MLPALHAASMLMPWFAGIMPLVGRPHALATRLAMHGAAASWWGGSVAGRLVVGRLVVGRFVAARLRDVPVRGGALGQSWRCAEAAILAGRGLARPGWELVV